MLLGPPLTYGAPTTVAPVAGRPVPEGLKIPSWWREDAGQQNLLAAADAVRSRR